MRTQTSRRVLPIIPAILIFTAASTGTVLASDACSVAIVRKLTNAVQSVDRHTEPTHKHTKQTLAAWEVWGNEYLAKHGHPFVPPTHKHTTDEPLSPEELARLKFECEIPPIPTVDMAVFPLLPPEELVPVWTDVDVPAEVAAVPPGPIFTGPSPTPFYPLQPVFFGPGVTPPAVAPLVGVTPEPESWVLLATGLVAVFGSRKLLKRTKAI